MTICLPDVTRLYRTLADSHPALHRGAVRCLTCGRTEAVDSATCLRKGGPTCCGQTMRLGDDRP